MNVASPLGLNIVVYDLEIVNEIGKPTQADPTGKPIGWEDHDKMGLSVGCLYDYRTGEYRVFMQDNLHLLVNRLNDADMVVAFNHINFDNQLLRAECKKRQDAEIGATTPVEGGLFPMLREDTPLNNYDMLVEGRRGIGWDESKRFPSGCRLDNFLEATFGQGLMKTSNGEEAPRMWQRGEFGACTDYCLADVHREKTLFDFIWHHGFAITAANGRHDFASPKARYIECKKKVTGNA